MQIFRWKHSPITYDNLTILIIGLCCCKRSIHIIVKFSAEVIVMCKNGKFQSYWNKYLFSFIFVLLIKMYVNKYYKMIFWPKNEIISLSKSFFKSKEFLELIFSKTYSDGSDILRIIAIALFFFIKKSSPAPLTPQKSFSLLFFKIVLLIIFQLIFHQFIFSL